ncbi:MAG: pilus assembly protein TadG-related protein [Alphaproteobacteria bacterium]
MWRLDTLLDLYARARDTRGAIAVVTALLFPVIAGFAGLGVDVGYWYQARRWLQTVADSAAIGGARELALNNATGIASAARGDAVRNGYDAANVATITVNSPPTSGPNTGNNAAVEVIIPDSLTPYFTSLFVTDPIAIQARAVATATVEDEFCVLTLDPTAGDATGLADDSKVELSGCGVMTNSNSPTALHLMDSARLLIDDGANAVVGDFVQEGGSDIDPQPQTGSIPASDPLAGLDVPPFAGCDFTNTVLTSETTISPGVYCDGLTITNNINVDVLPGTYIIDGGDLRVEDVSKLEGNEAVFILTSSSGPADIGSLSVVEHSRIEVTAPTSGDFADILIYQDRDAPSTGVNQIAGSSSGPGPAPGVETNGFLYLPSQELVMTEDAKLEQDHLIGGCPKLIVSQITLSGDAKIEIECDENAVTRDVGRRIVRLSE